MFRIFIGAMTLSAGMAAADTLAVFDEGGAPLKIDTANVKSCQLIFDSKGAAFELCPLQKIEMRPPQSTRTRPGQSGGSGQANVVYTKTTN